MYALFGGLVASGLNMLSIFLLDSMAIRVYTDSMQKQENQLREPWHTDVCLWLDYYGDLLSLRQREVLTLYFDEDWSLSEIAEHTGLSRQGIHDQIRRGVARLSALERSLELAQRARLMGELIKTASRQHQSGDDQGLRQSLSAMTKLLGQAADGRGEHDGTL